MRMESTCMQVHQLESEAGEETLVLTASLREGTLSTLGSNKGLHFLHARDDLKLNFFSFCAQGNLGMCSLSVLLQHLLEFNLFGNIIFSLIFAKADEPSSFHSMSFTFTFPAEFDSYRQQFL